MSMIKKELISIPKLKCLRCGWEWIPRKPEVILCPNPKCRSPYWNRPRKGKKTG